MPRDYHRRPRYMSRRRLTPRHMKAQMRGRRPGLIRPVLGASVTYVTLVCPSRGLWLVTGSLTGEGFTAMGDVQVQIDPGQDTGSLQCCSGLKVPGSWQVLRRRLQFGSLGD